MALEEATSRDVWQETVLVLNNEFGKNLDNLEKAHLLYEKAKETKESCEKQVLLWLNMMVLVWCLLAFCSWAIIGSNHYCYCNDWSLGQCWSINVLAVVDHWVLWSSLNENFECQSYIYARHDAIDATEGTSSMNANIAGMFTLALDPCLIYDTDRYGWIGGPLCACAPVRLHWRRPQPTVI